MVTRRTLITGASALAAYGRVEAATRRRRGDYVTGDPASMGGKLLAWWHADDHANVLMTDDGAGVISSWKDRIRLLNLTAATTARPTWTATGFDGSRSAVTGDGVANVLTLASTGDLPVGTVGSWIILALKVTSTATSDRIFGYGNSTGVTSRIIQKNGSDRFVLNDGTSTLTNLIPNTTTGLQVVAARFATGGLAIEGWINGAPFSPVSAGTTGFSTTATRIRMFASLAPTAANFSNVAVRQALILADVLTPLEVRRLSLGLLRN